VLITPDLILTLWLVIMYQVALQVKTFHNIQKNKRAIMKIKTSDEYSTNGIVVRYGILPWITAKRLIIVVKKYSNSNNIINRINADSKVGIKFGLVLSRIFSPGCLGLLMLMLFLQFTI
jgi:hypothetical protein